MKKTITLFVLFFGLTFSIQAQNLSKTEITKFETEVKGLLSYLEETLNFIGDSTSSPLEKEIVFAESWSKIFIDDKVQIEDDLDVNRKTPINKDVQAYLKDIDFFFKNAQFKFDLQSITNSTRDDGSVYFKASLTRQLVATTINDEPVNNVKSRFVEINLDRQNNSLKIASIYTTKINEKESLSNWWNSLSMNWKTRLGDGIKLYDTIPIETVGLINSSDFMASYPSIDPMTGETLMKEKLFKTEADMQELYRKLKLVTQKQQVDMSGIREIITVEPLSELSDLVSLNISGTSVDDIAPLRNANKLKVLRANSTFIDDLSPMKYCITLEELDLGNTNVSDLSVLPSLRNIQKLDISNTMVTRLGDLKNCPDLCAINLSGCKISNIAPLQDMSELKSVDISNTSVRDLSPLAKISNLQSLNISSTPIANLEPLSQTENLRELYCSQTNINDLTPLKSNRRLSKIYCDQTKIGDAEASAFTKDNPFTLVIFDTEALVNWWNELPLYWKAVFSKQININSEPTTEQLHQIINLQELDLSDNTYIQNLLPVSRLTNLKTLNIARTEISNLFAIQNLTNLENLNLEGTYITSLEPLKDLSALKWLNISNTPVNKLIPLSNDNNIEVIIADNTPLRQQDVIDLKEQQRQVTVVYRTQELEQWWLGTDETWKAIFRQHIGTHEEMPSALELQQIADLREIAVTSEFSIITLEPLASCIWIESLSVSNQKIRDLDALSNKPYMRELYVNNTPVATLKPIENNIMMEIIDIENTQISDLGPLSRMNNLITLNAAGTPVKALKPLQNLNNLENLFINNTDVKTLTPIENLPKLRQLKVYNTKVRGKSIEKLQQKRLDLNIIYY